MIILSKFGYKGLINEEIKFVDGDFLKEINIFYEKGRYKIENKTSNFSLFRKILPATEDNYIVFPDDVLRMGTLEFLLMRFNTGVVSEKGMNSNMEDQHLEIQNLRISSKIPCSLFCILDG